MSTRRIGLDVGGTKCLGVVVDDGGQVLQQQRVPTPKGPDAIIDTLAGLVGELGPATTVGVGMPGLVTRDGVLRAAPNLVDIRDFRVAELLSRRVGLPVEVDNDATCATVAEWRCGVARGADEYVLVALGTGIGGGLVSGGRLMRGANGFAGEIGHMVVDPQGPPCPCGRSGCWERFASGSGLGRLAREAAESHGAPRLVELAGGNVDDVRGEHVQRAALEGDPGALAVIDDFARWVALGLANLTNLIDPSLIVIGGFLAADGPLYLEPIRRWFARSLFAPDLRAHPAVEFAELGQLAGAVGASLLHDVH